MSLKEILGEDYREDMTDEEITSAMEKKVLASGKYENKEKVDAERRKATERQKELEDKIKAKMSDDELSAKEVEDLKAKIESLETEKRENSIRHSKSIATANMSEAKSILEIKDKDKDYEEFINAISGEDSDVSSKTSSYIMKMIKDAYEKGKATATKTTLGNLGRQVIGADGKAVDADKALVQSLLASTPKQVSSENSNFN